LPGAPTPASALLVLPLMLAFGFFSNLTYATTGSLLRRLAGARPTPAGGSTAAWPPCPGADGRVDALERAMSTDRPHPPLSADEVRGLWLGLIGVLIFSLTLPMTRLAVGTPDAPQLSGCSSPSGAPRWPGALSRFFLAFTCARRDRTGRLAAGPGHRRWGWCSAFRCSPRWRCAMWKRCTPA
jgi:hypothetical protein